MSTDKMPLYKTLHGKVVTTQNATQTKIPRGQKNITGKMSHTLKVKSFAGRNFRDFASFLGVRESLYPRNRTFIGVREILHEKSLKMASK